MRPLFLIVLLNFAVWLADINPVYAFLEATPSTTKGVSVSLKNDSLFWYSTPFPTSGQLLLTLSINNLTALKIAGEVRLVFLAIASELNFDALTVEPLFCDLGELKCPLHTGFYVENISLAAQDSAQIHLLVTLPIEYCKDKVHLQAALLFRAQDESNTPYIAKNSLYFSF